MNDLNQLDKMVYWDEKLFNFSPTNHVVYIKCNKNQIWDEKNIIHSKRPSQNTACNIGMNKIN